MEALFVDLPNFYSHLLNSGLADARLLRDYFLEWFDFDRLATALTKELSSPIWVFYSGRRFGPRSNRIENDYLNNFIDRINTLKGVTAWDVNIPGEQREPARYNCEHCGNSGVAQWESEKGIDASLTVHLFDTMESWDVAYLLSGDADFVPAVRSLRRRGKVVVGAGFNNASSALVRECYDYIELVEAFFEDDFSAFMLFRKDGIIQKWFDDAVFSSSRKEDIDLSFEWQFLGSNLEKTHHHLDRLSETPKAYYHVTLAAVGPLDLSSRHEKLRSFYSLFPRFSAKVTNPKNHYELRVSPLAWNGVMRRFDDLLSYFKASHIKEGTFAERGFFAKYTFNSENSQYEVNQS